ncbi:MAG TPA: hypothetical protein PLX20_15930 [Rhodocyclaceae bacterium]|nr:hypothetical protein [Rhodocyclaceae bacterium]HNB80118.1 hypothetical protein [Rhodocyclaceae bacterium]HNH14627.1 hypothetical protein [Rhodocyclaceae bacterium]
MPLASRTRPLLRIRRLTTAMRIAAYFAALAAAIAIAWHYPFLFELPVIVAIGLLYWAFFAGKGGSD